jgi:chromatin remodeling complex protein RSC6
MVKPVDPAQGIFDFGESPEQPKKRKPADPGYKEVHEKYNPTEKDPKAKAAENEEFKDKRQPKSELIRQAEIDKMKEILNKPKTGGGGGGGTGIGKMNRDITKNMKAGGKVSSASKRADGCCVKGKTKGRMV